jgi:calcium-dependent protein kinase
LENVLYEHAGSNAGIKLIDYGLARKFGRGVQCWKVCGAEYWLAPEVHFSSTFSPSSDIWSIGVVAFVLLSGGTYPFGTDCELDVNRLEKAEYTFGNEWQERKISNDAKQFVQKCLQRNPDNRLTAKEALDYVREWMANVEPDDLFELDDQPLPLLRKEPGGTLRGRQDFELYGQLKKRVLMAMANTMDKSSLDELKDVLVGFDTDGTGTLTLEQVRQAVTEFHQGKGEASPLTKEDIKEMFKGSQQDRPGTIHYIAFLDAVLESQGMATQERLGKTFDRADPKGKGWILKKDIKQILRPYCDEDFVERMIKEAGCEFHWPVLAEVVDYDKFLQSMFKDPAKGMDHIRRLVD